MNEPRMSKALDFMVTQIMTPESVRGLSNTYDFFMTYNSCYYVERNMIDGKIIQTHRVQANKPGSKGSENAEV